MDLFWYLCGVASTLSVLPLLLPWLRGSARFNALPAPSWPIAAGLVLALAGLMGLWRALVPAAPPFTAAAAPASTAQARAASAQAAAGSTAQLGQVGGSMDGAIANLETRLARGGGSSEDWELLAKSFDYLGRPDDAAKARAHQLPPPPIDAASLTAALGRTFGGAHTAAGPAAPAPEAPVLSAESIQLLAQASAARRAKNPKAAAAIYATLSARGQMNADAWADYADVSASLQGNKLAGTPESYIMRALALEPRHTKALWLKASAEEELQRWQEAIGTWQTLASELAPDSADARIVAANLEQDQKRSGAPPPAVPGLGVPALRNLTASGAGAVVSGEINIAQQLAAKARQGETLFVVARSADAPGPPLAVLRTAVSTWPLQFQLDDSLAMMPGRTLSSADRITVEARISQSGQATPDSGDMAGSSGILSSAAHEPVRIIIDRVQP